MATETLNHPPFPPLRWDRYFWTGSITLASWSGFQSRRGAYASVSSGEPSDGTARLVVQPPGQRAGASPTQEQAAAFRYLIDHEAEVFAAVVRALVDYYAGEREAYLDDDDGIGADELPEVSDPREMRSLVGLSGVHIMAAARDGMAYVGLEFGCVWDEEHGAGVLTHRGRIINTGQADVSFSEGDEEDDAERAGVTA